MTDSDRFECDGCGASFADHAAAVDHIYDEHLNVEDYLIDHRNAEPEAVHD